MNTEQLVERLIAFAEAGNQQKIQLANGSIIQGWVMEITDEALFISSGYSDKVGKDQWIKHQDLITAELFYWDNKNDTWAVFHLND
uniref:hypothetical protein n=1 Tax=uncultured Acinetobacter sp. TaxID=165433 RepID=UPI002627D993|nr:hypothetical protein [uncultured Acinetobacter sp.]